MEEERLLKRKTKAKNENNQTLFISICTDLADLFIKEGRHQLAVNEYKQIADIYKSQNKSIEYAQAHRGIGEAYLGLHDFEKAVDHQKIYLNIANQEECKLEKQRALATMGHTYLTWYLETQSNPDVTLNAAYKYFMKSLIVAESLTGISKIERSDMIARLFSNLGLVKDCLGDYKKALELLHRSITICKQNDIYEQLSRGYISIASVSEKCDNFNDAILYYNLAIEAAKKLKNNVDLMCAAFLAKSETAIRLADFHSAKQILLKAYKLKTPNIQDRKNFERNLKIVASMCNVEDKLVITTDSQKERKELYEKMGDGACELKIYAKAIEYYKLMLECAEKSGVSGRELASCYYSLAETYKDNNQFAEAVEYFEKEYELCIDLKDRLNTLSKIADTKEMAGAPVSEVKAVYERAFSNCRSHMNLKEEKRMVSRCIGYLRRNNLHSDAFQLSQYFNTLANTNFEDESSSSECESDDSEAKPNIGDDIDLDDITDESDASDIENQHSHNRHESSVGRRRPKNLMVKKNAKGESQLHTACINGSVQVARHLLEQGHPVNVRDNSGWLPLHEACNHGNVDIVKLLIDKGAAINDRGGTHCNGITPLYDAASNGHLHIVRLLLDSGASATIKTDDGDTALNILKVWQKNHPPYGEDLALYSSLVERMSNAMEKAGQSTKPTPLPRTQSANIELTPKASQRERHLRRSGTDVFDEDLFGLSEQILEDKSDGDGASEYIEVMGTLRNKTSIGAVKKTSPNVSKRSALVSVDDNVDDWLEDDVQMSKATKKRKTSHGSDLKTPAFRCGSLGQGGAKTQSASPKKRTSEDYGIPRISYEDYSDNDVIIENDRGSPTSRERRISSDSRSSTSSTSSVKRKSQTSLLDAGFSRIRGESSSYTKKLSDINRRSSSSAMPVKRTNSFEKRPSQQKLVSFGHTRDVVEADSTTTVSSQVRSAPEQSQRVAAAVADLMVFVDVKIEGMVFRVPVLLSQVQTNTIGWLAEQAAAKFARKQCTRPKLEMETTTGALLSDDDPLSLLFPLGAKQAEPVVGKVVELNLPPLAERYKEACSHLNAEINDSLCTILEEMSIILSLKDSGFMSKTLSPLCKALSYQSSLSELDLSGNFLDNDSVTKLCASLSSLSNLSLLNLKCTGLKSGHLVELVKVLMTNPGSVLQKLASLDLSDNILGDRSLPHLAQITRQVMLTSLNLSNVHLTGEIFRDDKSLTLCLDRIQCLDLSDNRLATSDIIRFISWTCASKLVTLNVSRNLPNNEDVLAGLIDFLREAEGQLELKSLNLSRCNVTENELYEFLRLSLRMSMSNVNLSYNPRLTGISLRRVLECSCLENINLIGCTDILKYFENCGGCDLLQGSGANDGKVLKVSPNLQDYPWQVETLIDMFRNKYSDCYIERGSYFLLLSSKTLVNS